MISIKDQQNVFHINWIKRIIKEDNTSTLKNIVDGLTKRGGGVNYIKNLCLKSPMAILDNIIVSEFWKRVACTWCKLCYDITQHVTQNEDLLNKPLFLMMKLNFETNH